MKKALLCLAVIASCKSEADIPPWIVQEPRVLAVRTVPAEARPNQAVKREVLAVDAQGHRLTLAPQFFRCEIPKLLGERTSIGQACLQGHGLLPIPADAPIDPLACKRFGPTPDPPEDEEALLPRPTAPDMSGGYYSPEHLRLSGPNLHLSAFFRVRTRCDLLGATREVFDAFEAHYAPNRAPNLALAELSPPSQKVEDRWELHLPIGVPTKIALQVAAVESELYAIYRIPSNRIDPARETLTLRWFASGATLARSEERKDSIDLDRTSAFENELTLGPAGRASVWLVLQDDRGGTSWRQLLVFAAKSPSSPPPR